MIQLHITMVPTITKYGKFRKKEWVKNAKIPFEAFSEGSYALMWEGFERDTGSIVTGKHRSEEHTSESSHSAKSRMPSSA